MLQLANTITDESPLAIWIVHFAIQQQKTKTIVPLPEPSLFTYITKLWSDCDSFYSKFHGMRKAKTWWHVSVRQRQSMNPRLIIEFCTLENHQQNHSERIIGSVRIRPVQENLKTKMADLNSGWNRNTHDSPCQAAIDWLIGWLLWHKYISHSLIPSPAHNVDLNRWQQGILLIIFIFYFFIFYIKKL